VVRFGLVAALALAAGLAGCTGDPNGPAPQATRTANAPTSTARATNAAPLPGCDVLAASVPASVGTVAIDQANPQPSGQSRPDSYEIGR
jgi:hypothetical protein